MLSKNVCWLLSNQKEVKRVWVKGSQILLARILLGLMAAAGWIADRKLSLQKFLMLQLLCLE